MTPKDALKVLIRDVDLEDGQKRILLANLPEMDDAAVRELGAALAEYRVQQAAAAKRTLAAIDALSDIDPIER